MDMSVPFKKREIPWLNVVAFHKEIARRAEESFFALPLGRSPSDRWSSITAWEPPDMAGDWHFPAQALQSNPFGNLIHGGGLVEAFVGGPCWVRFRREEDNWRQEWCPFLYRSIRLDSQDDGSFRIIPEQGAWEVSPIVLGVLERKGFLPRRPLEDLIPELLEAASASSQTIDQPLTSRLVEALCRELPDFAELFVKRVDLRLASHTPSNWVIFSPPPTGPLTQHLVRDYDRLSEILTDTENGVGGLRLFEGFPDEGPSGHEEPTPIIPLNDSQRAAVGGILESKPVTVISGPPGCGKSQVVLSLMLNAWQRGISVLFASNNNQAVDVVRDRLQRFEGHFPIAVRAGSRKKSTVIQALADTLNFITGRNAAATNNRESASAKRDGLLAKQEALRTFLGSKLPQRVDEAVRSALGAYATFQQTRGELRATYDALLREFDAFGVESRPESFFQEIVLPLDAWLARLSEYQEILNQDEAKRRSLRLESDTAGETRDRAAQRAGLESSSINSWAWLISGPGPELLRSWLDRLKELLVQPLDQYLAPYDWLPEFEKWHAEAEAREWAASARQLASDIRSGCAQLGPKLTHVEGVKKRYDAQMSKVQLLGVPAAIMVESSVLSDWSEAYALETSLPVAKLDWTPWSQRRRAIRRMKRAEKILRSAYPLTVWRGIGKLSSEGRDNLSTIVEQTQVWLSVRSEWEAAQSVREEIEEMLCDLRGRCTGLTGFEKVPDNPDLPKWLEAARDLTEIALCADKAALAWRKRMLAEKTAADIGSTITDYIAIASGVPMKEAWTRGPGSSFHAILMRVGSAPSPQSVLDARAALYTDSLMVLIESWEQARDAERLSRQRLIDIDNVPTTRRRCQEWKAEGPPNLRVDSIPEERLPQKDDPIFQRSANYRNWALRWKQFSEQTQPELKKRSDGEYQWAAATLNEALDLLPPGEQNTVTRTGVEAILGANRNDWATAEVQKIFEAYSPNRIKADIDRLDAQIEGLSFDLAKQDWLQRMTADSSIQKALDDLHTHYRRNNERIEEAAFPLFRRSLAAVPIWITTAQSPQSIPMLPDLFDILVIDEATQCTVTNILPLIYRAKRIAVIGDPEQLPAIPNISPAAESALAAKHGIEENLLNVIGHAENDLYKAAVRCLPGGRHDVIALQEHYRSHPLIIGFSNLHVYQTALKVRTDPAHVASLPFGSSVHGQHVSGLCVRGKFNSSWQNQPEAEAVCNLVKRLRQGLEARSRSLGIVTPFRAQTELIAEQLRSLDLLDGVTVGTVHTFQGDERDIMIFSPVVSRGIGDGAARWVENPKNLINVAVTRARLALFLVADFEICRLQEGLLGDLAKYVDTVEKLRKTSEEELELFSWMVVQGWNPIVHRVERDIEIDFVLSYEGKRLAIEVDGAQHGDTTEQDRARDTFLRGMGYDVLRVPARAVRETPSLVIKQIGERTGLAV
jgi:very-short-patch-repair endonuclease